MDNAGVTITGAMGDYAYQFGPFRLEIESRQLFRDGRPVPLTPKAAETLLILVGNQGRVVPKRELLEAVWPAVHVEEIGLARNISVLRKVLEGGHGDRRLIETVPRRGYRFTAAIEVLPPAGSEDGRTPAVAVLPLKRLDADGRDDYLGLGIADALILRLTRLRNLVVRPTNAVRSLGAWGSDPVAAGRALRVDWVLDGCIQRCKDRLRATVQLVRVDDGATVWAGKFDERLGDVFALEDSISGRVAELIIPTLSADDRLRIRRRHTSSADAHRCCLQGRYHWNRRTDDGLRRAIECFNEAVAADPTCALGYVGLADSYTLLGTVVYGAYRRRDAWPKARSAVERALEIDDQLAEAHASLAFINFRYDWDWPAAERRFVRAIELNPHYATARQWYAYLLSTRGDHARAMREIRCAQALDPLSQPIATGIGRLLYFAGRYEEAEAECRRAIEMDVSFAGAHLDLGLVYEQVGRYDDAIAEFTRALQLSGGSHIPLAHLGHAYGVSGRHEKARDVLLELGRLSTRFDVAHSDRAVVLVGMGDRAEALACLTRAYEDRDGFMVLLKVEPLLAPLREEPAFQELLLRLDLLPRPGSEPALAPSQQSVNQM